MQRKNIYCHSLKISFIKEEVTLCIYISYTFPKRIKRFITVKHQKQKHF